ncbi:MAG: hypothetical protein IPL49_10465 [Saprospirales bacterium]|nr:hypothetical protein [Saprospirales bacterium]MBK8491288.1 hypothetical protein [Saprospirales bacterium]
METIRMGTKVVNAILLSLVFLLLTAMGVTQVAGETFFTVGNISFLVFYLVFGLALVQFIRKRDMGWQNYVLAIVWVGIGWIVILITIFYPVFNEIMGADDAPAVIYARMVEQLIAIMERVDTGEDKEFLYQLLIKLIVFIQVMSLLGAILLVSILIYGLKYFAPFFQDLYDRYPIKRAGTALFLILGGLWVYRIFFGSLTSELMAGYRFKDLKDIPEKLTMGMKVDNLQWAMGDITSFLGELNLDPVVLILEATIFFLFVVTLLSRRIHINHANLLSDEYA